MDEMIITPDVFAHVIASFKISFPIAVALSGGSDSMALTLLLHEFLTNHAINYPQPLVALTVDHQLRSESTQEALQVHQWMQDLNINHTILTWNHEALNTKIEEQARQARYQLLIDYCDQHHVPTLMTAHHSGDQIETFLMRLNRGSGLLGLCSIRAVTQLERGIQLIRPCLTFSHDALRSTLIQRFHHPFVDDPSNEMKKFERVRWRKLVAQIPDFNETNMIQSIQNLQTIESELNEIAQVFEQNHVIFQPDSGILDLEKIKLLIPTSAKIVLKRILIHYGTSKNPCSQRILDHLYAKIAQPTFNGATAQGCVLKRIKGKRLIIFSEHRLR